MNFITSIKNCFTSRKNHRKLSPLANHIDTAIHKRKRRTGIHLYQGTEIASVNDLLMVCRLMAESMTDHYQANTVRNRTKIFEWAVEMQARAVSCKHQLNTDHGVVEISKGRACRGHTNYLIAVEDFDIYLMAVCRRHPIVGKRLQCAWKEILRITGSKQQVAFNFSQKEQVGGHFRPNV